jgi:hypothetical protein
MLFDGVLRTAEKLGFAAFLHRRQRQMMPGGDKRKSWFGPQSPTAARGDRFSGAAGPKHASLIDC